MTKLTFLAYPPTLHRVNNPAMPDAQVCFCGRTALMLWRGGKAVMVVEYETRERSTAACDAISRFSKRNIAKRERRAA